MNADDPIYKEIILDLYRNPLNKKMLADFDFKRREFNPVCGDDIEIALAFDEGGRVCAIGHQGAGCAISQAAVSLLTEQMKQKTADEIRRFTEKDMLALLPIRVSHTRLKCALLGWQILRGL